MDRSIRGVLPYPTLPYSTLLYSTLLYSRESSIYIRFPSPQPASQPASRISSPFSPFIAHAATACACSCQSCHVMSCRCHGLINESCSVCLSVCLSVGSLETHNSLYIAKSVGELYIYIYIYIILLSCHTIYTTRVYIYIPISIIFRLGFLHFLRPM